MSLDFGENLADIFFSLGHVIVLLALAPLLQGWIKKVKAFWQMRKGPSLWQPYRDLYKYFRKEEVISEHASWITLITPALVLGSSLLAALVIPNPWGWAPMSQYGTIFWLVVSFGLARFFTALAGLDAASSFGGMGSSRELFVGALVEPGFALSLIVLALMGGSTSLSELVLKLQGISLFETPHLLSVLALGFMAIAEMGRIPVDNPDTHLELTMIHEGMLLDYSGRSLAFLNWAEQLKQLILLELLALLMGERNVWINIGCVVVWGALFATIESLNVKMRLFRIPNYLAAGTASAVLALVTLWIMKGGI